ncbi:Uncharacterised protein [Mycobacteroides abscessus subsp. abscessus]|nr:Uncharacterised protein [Mycobacteroides abscessus subsp. abscessus]
MAFTVASATLNSKFSLPVTFLNFDQLVGHPHLGAGVDPVHRGVQQLDQGCR